jgi:hypothetical protein
MVERHFRTKLPFYQFKERQFPKERRSPLDRGESLKSRTERANINMKLA